MKPLRSSASVTVEPRRTDLHTTLCAGGVSRSSAASASSHSHHLSCAMASPQLDFTDQPVDFGFYIVLITMGSLVTDSEEALMAQ
jgi:hypothetical protein